MLAWTRYEPGRKSQACQERSLVALDPINTGRCSRYYSHDLSPCSLKRTIAISQRPYLSEGEGHEEITTDRVHQFVKNPI